MNIRTTVRPVSGPVWKPPTVELEAPDLGLFSELNWQLAELRARCTPVSLHAVEFFYIASVIYAADKLIPRTKAADNWTREVSLSIPIESVTVWRRVQGLIEECVSFLMGDIWHLDFTPLEDTLWPMQDERAIVKARGADPQHVIGDAACLFSGGLDSLIGSIDWLETHADKKILLVGHHDQHVAGPLRDQNALMELMKEPYGDRIDRLQVRVGQTPSGKETSFRSRSLVFLGLGIVAATSLGEDVPLLIPENGTISVNIPLTPSRRGSCSTRTTHPRFLEMVARLLAELGIANPIENPLRLKTKGECVARCRNLDLLKRLIPSSVSCAKTGHKRMWVQKDAKGCGRCVPCIFRRAALHTIGRDTETYGVDICRGQVDVQADRDLANDFRAVLSFLRNGASTEEIGEVLLSNGRLPLAELDAYVRVVEVAMQEIRVLINDKGTSEIKALMSLAERAAT